jgi:WhiB family redox-sensing transcriptional regulator
MPSRSSTRHEPRTAYATPPQILSDEGACRGTDPEVFFPLNSRDLARAIDICKRCDHQALCLDWALTTGQTHGVWGATGPEERIRLAEEAS